MRLIYLQGEGDERARQEWEKEREFRRIFRDDDICGKVHHGLHVLPLRPKKMWALHSYRLEDVEIHEKSKEQKPAWTDDGETMIVGAV